MEPLRVRGWEKNRTDFYRALLSMHTSKAMLEAYSLCDTWYSSKIFEYFIFFVILVHLYQNMYSKIFQTICFNIPCITNISRTKCFNCDRKLYIKTCYDSKSLRIITNCDNYNILTIYKNTHKSKYDQRVCKMFQYSQIVKWLS